MKLKYAGVVSVMDYVPRGELFGVWKRMDYFSEKLVRIYVAELAMVLGKKLKIFKHYHCGTSRLTLGYYLVDCVLCCLDFLHESKIIYRDVKVGSRLYFQTIFMLLVSMHRLCEISHFILYFNCLPCYDSCVMFDHDNDAAAFPDGERVD